MKKEKILSIFYRFAVLSVIFTLIFILLKYIVVFVVFILVYILLSLSFVWFKTSLWAINEASEKNKKPDWDKPFSVMISLKNENPTKFWWVLKNVFDSRGEKQVLIGDDGSDLKNLNKYIEICKEYKKKGENITFFSFKSIKKRKVQCFLHKLAKYDLIVNLDSDVIVQKDTFIRLLAPFHNKKVGIANSRLIIFDRGKIIDKCYKALYETANQIGRRIFGGFGQMSCASGELLAYRKEILDKNFDKYHKAFYLWGIPVTYGEDRLLTNIIIKEGYNSVYCEDSVGLTWGKENLDGFIRQQLRWRRSWIRESVKCLSFSYKKPILFFNTLGNLILPILFSLIIITLIMKSIISSNLYIILGILAISIITTYIRDLPLIIEDPSIIKSLYIFALINLVFITPIWLFAILTVDSTTWGGRFCESLTR